MNESKSKTHHHKTVCLLGKNLSGKLNWRPNTLKPPNVTDGVRFEQELGRLELSAYVQNPGRGQKADPAL